MVTMLKFFYISPLNCPTSDSNGTDKCILFGFEFIVFTNPFICSLKG
jgi:hypothetical protein